MIVPLTVFYARHVREHIHTFMHTQPHTHTKTHGHLTSGVEWSGALLGEAAGRGEEGVARQGKAERRTAARRSGVGRGEAERSGLIQRRVKLRGRQSWVTLRRHEQLEILCQPNR